MVRLVLKWTEVLEKLKKLNETLEEEHRMIWQPEVGEFMAESSTGQPFWDTMDDLVKVEIDMKLRKDQINSFLGENEKMVTMTTYPLIGYNDYTVPALKIGLKNVMKSSIFYPMTRWPVHIRYTESFCGTLLYILLPSIVKCN